LQANAVATLKRVQGDVMLGAGVKLGLLLKLGESQCIKTKNSLAKAADANLFLPLESKNFTRKEGLRIPPKDALSAEKYENRKKEKNFTTQSAQNADAKQKFHSNQLKEKKFFAGNASKKTNNTDQIKQKGQIHQ